MPAVEIGVLFEIGSVCRIVVDGMKPPGGAAGSV